MNKIRLLLGIAFLGMFISCQENEATSEIMNSSI